jgi:hypothetical protein
MTKTPLKGTRRLFSKLLSGHGMYSHARMNNQERLSLGSELPLSFRHSKIHFVDLIGFESQRIGALLMVLK